jgi:Na+-driven multidrug efflux pump
MQGEYMTLATLTVAEPPNARNRPTYQKIAIIAPIMLTICGSLTGMMTLINRDESGSFLHQWASAFVFASLLALPIGIIVMSVVSQLIQKLLSGATTHVQNLLTGVVMSLIMESAMAASTAISHAGLSNLNQFTEAWSQNFIDALPLGLVIATLMTLIIKPKLETFMQS